MGAIEHTPHHAYPDEVVGEDTHLQGAYALDPVVAAEGVVMGVAGIGHQEVLAAQTIGERGVAHGLDDEGHTSMGHKGVAHLQVEVEEEFSVLIVLAALLTAVAHLQGALIGAIASAGVLVESLADEAVDKGVAINPHTHIVGVAVVIVGYLRLDVPRLALLDDGLCHGRAGAAAQESGDDGKYEERGWNSHGPKYR